jgi:hypothetical protein
MVAVLPPAAPHFWLSPLHYRSGMNVLSDIHLNAGQPALPPTAIARGEAAASANRLGPPCARTGEQVLDPAMILPDCRKGNGTGFKRKVGELPGRGMLAHCAGECGAYNLKQRSAVSLQTPVHVLLPSLFICFLSPRRREPPLRSFWNTHPCLRTHLLYGDYNSTYIPINDFHHCHRLYGRRFAGECDERRRHALKLHRWKLHAHVALI